MAIHVNRNLEIGLTKRTVTVSDRLDLPGGARVSSVVFAPGDAQLLQLLLDIVSGAPLGSCVAFQERVDQALAPHNAGASEQREVLS
jgi:hypothetical protein